MLANKPPLDTQLETEYEFLQERLPQGRAVRLALRMALLIAQVGVIVSETIVEVAATVKEQLQTAFKRHLANIADESQVLATQLSYAEINRVPAVEQARMVSEGRSATVVSDAAVSQRRVAPEVQAALVEHCSDHAAAMRKLASRADATLETLAFLAESTDVRTRFNVAANIGPRMRVDEPGLANKKEAIFSALIADYQSEFSPYLVPVCQSPDQLREMFANTSKTLGVIDVFVENPYTPDSVLLDIACSTKMQIVQHDVAVRAKQLLQVRTDLRDSVGIQDDMAP